MFSSENAGAVSEEEGLGGAGEEGSAGPVEGDGEVPASPDAQPVKENRIARHNSAERIRFIIKTPGRDGIVMFFSITKQVYRLGSEDGK